MTRSVERAVTSKESLGAGKFLRVNVGTPTTPRHRYVAISRIITIDEFSPDAYAPIRTGVIVGSRPEDIIVSCEPAFVLVERCEAKIAGRDES